MTLSSIGQGIIVGVSLLGTAACLDSSKRPPVVATAIKEEVDCRTVDQRAAELIVKRDSIRVSANVLDAAIAKCSPDARRHHQRAIAAAALGDAAAESINMNRAVELAEQSGDRCLLDQMLIERRALSQRRAVNEELPASCRELQRLRK